MCLQQPDEGSRYFNGSLLWETALFHRGNLLLLVTSQSDSSCLIAFLNLFLCYLWICCLCHFFLSLCCTHLFSHSPYSFPKFFHAPPRHSCVYPASMLEAPVCLSALEEKGGSALVRCHAPHQVLYKACLFLDPHHNNTRVSPHTPWAQSSLRKQATAITRSQTERRRKACAHFPNRRLTHCSAIIAHESLPKKHLTFFGCITYDFIVYIYKRKK